MPRQGCRTLPAFPSQVQWVDFQGHDEERYRQSLQELVGGLLGRTTRRDPPVENLLQPLGQPLPTL